MTQEDSRNNALCVLSGKRSDLKANIFFPVITDIDLLMDNLVSLVLCMCPEQNELKWVRQTCWQQLTFAQFRKVLLSGLLCLVSEPLKSMDRFCPIKQNLTLKMWTEIWKGVNTIVLV